MSSILTFFQLVRHFKFGVLLISWRNCPLINSHCVICWKSTPNCRHVRVSSGYSLGRWAWSTVGNRWCRVWSPNTISVRGLCPLTSTRSRVESRVWRPQSRSSLLRQCQIESHSTNTVSLFKERNISISVAQQTKTVRRTLVKEEGIRIMGGIYLT